MAANPNTDFTAGQILTADQQNRFPRGVMGYALSTTNSAFSTTVVDITGMSITFTAVANRLYEATFSATIDQNSSATLSLYLTDGSNNVQNYYQNSAPASINIQTFSYLFTSTAGSITRKVRTNISGGAATVLHGSNTFAYSFVIKDLGPA
jgi:hypothetical protein